MSVKEEVKAEQQRVLNEKKEQRKANEVKRKFDKKKLITIAIGIVCIIVLIVIVARPDEYDRERIKRAIKSKEQIYTLYKDNTKGIINSSTVEDNVIIADSSRIAIWMANRSFDDDYDQITKKGNDKLNEVIEEATITLNNSIPIVLNSDNLIYEDYKTIKRGIEDEVVSEYINVENKKLYESIKGKYYYKEITESLEDQEYQNNQTKNILQSNLQTGMSESEVKKLAGLPNDTYKNDEAYFWVYDGVVLTMKNGYVYDVTYELE